MELDADRKRQPPSAGGEGRGTILCFSHLRWDWVFQRPQHLLTRAARSARVLFWEEPVWTEAGPPRVEARSTAEGVLVLRPHLPGGCDPAAAQRRLLDEALRGKGAALILWYYTPTTRPRRSTSRTTWARRWRLTSGWCSRTRRGRRSARRLRRTDQPRPMNGICVAITVTN